MIEKIKRIYFAVERFVNVASRVIIVIFCVVFAIGLISLAYEAYQQKDFGLLFMVSVVLIGSIWQALVKQKSITEELGDLLGAVKNTLDSMPVHDDKDNQNTSRVVAYKESLPSTWPACATCERWGGQRNPDVFQKKAEFNRGAKGRCLGGSRKNFEMAAASSCPEWDKWRVLE